MLDLNPASELADALQRSEAERARLEERIQQLEQANGHQEQFLGILSHDLRTPINAITGFGSILEDGLAGELTKLQANYVGKILSSSEKLLALIDDLLGLIRVQAGHFTLEPAPLRFADVMREVLAEHVPLAQRQGHMFVNNVPKNLPTLTADPARLRQVLGSLLDNALVHTPERSTVTLRARVAGDSLRVEVIDNGPGIAVGDRHKVFEPFTQLDVGNTRARGGFGLGLTSVKALVEAHGGHVGVEGEPGRGSTFWFTLPLRGAAQT